MALLAGWSLVVARFTGQDDFALGVPVSGRSRPELGGIVGLFANILPVRVDLSGRPHFREMLARVRAAMLFAYTHADGGRLELRDGGGEVVVSFRGSETLAWVNAAFNKL